MNNWMFSTLDKPESIEWDVMIVECVANLKETLNNFSKSGWYIYEINYNPNTKARCVTAYRINR